MTGKKSNALRDYHLLVARAAQGFEWQIRYDRHANPVQRSPTHYMTQAEANAAGEVALTALKHDLAGSVPPQDL